MMSILKIIEEQQKFAQRGFAKDILFRQRQLKCLKQLIKDNEMLLSAAVQLDLNKSSYESYLTELAPLYQELDYALKHLPQWARAKKVKTGLMNWPAKSFIYAEPYGTTLIIGAWNYPYQLTLMPLVAALAAGNTAIIKPSELASHAAAILAKLINTTFDPAYLYVVEGGVELTQTLLQHRFNKIFFTGSHTVGQIVAQAAAKYLTPTTLELGGKSPCLVLADANIKVAAKRIIWGKFLNAGQTCIAPDYLLVERAIYSSLLAELKKQIENTYGSQPQKNPNYARVINEKQLDRLQQLIKPEQIVIGGQIIVSERYMAPTLLKGVQFSDDIMQQEIFGPILPVIVFDDLDDTLAEIKKRPCPLAFYLFSNQKNLQRQIISELSFGGGCINDVIMQIANPRLPFGGVGASGIGSYHGEAGFNAFSHFKSIVKKSFWFEPPMKYPPYSRLKLKLIKAFFG